MSLPSDSGPPAPTVHEAERASGPSGAVEWGPQLTPEQAAERRRNGLDIVVRGDDERVNRRLARAVEALVGPPGPAQFPHTGRAGPLALPHFHQASRTPSGHSYYETAKRKARKKP